MGVKRSVPHAERLRALIYALSESPRRLRLTPGQARAVVEGKLGPRA